LIEAVKILDTAG
jgi:small GTP-binding protein